MQQADTGTKMIHLGKNTRSTIVSKGISAGRGQNTYRGQVRIAKKAEGARNYSQCDSLLIGDKCGAHTFPYLEIGNTSAKVEHEASTSKIGEDQIFYCRQRGLSAEDAVNMIVNGFCKDVFRELPMEFAVEAQKLLSVSLEGSVGLITSCLRSTNLQVRGGTQRHPPRHQLDGQQGRSPRHHGAERLGQEHARPRRWPAIPRYEVTGGIGHLRRQGPARDGAGRSRPRRRLHGVPVSGRNSRREQRVLPEGRHQRPAQASRPSRARRHGVHGAGARRRPRSCTSIRRC